ncbi:MAG: semialdehyde dehydrogenase, partial [Candidatus Saccharibacteria bacterium]|nr:semialdehyde dehydrogenase [Pseudorhodobacter sp.]
SGAALRVLEFGKKLIMKDNWRDALSPALVRQGADLIVHGKI